MDPYRYTGIEDLEDEKTEEKCTVEVLKTSANSLLERILSEAKASTAASLAEHSGWSRLKPATHWEEICKFAISGAPLLKDDERAHLIKELGRAGGPDAALGAFEALLAASAPTGLGPSVYHATLSACATNFSSEKAMRVFRAMQEAGSVGSVASYNMLIAALSQAGKVPEAFKVYEQLIDEGLEPNSFTFNMLIQGCTFKRRGLYKEALQVYEWCEDENQPLDAVAEGLLDCCRAAMLKAPSLDDALAALAAAQARGLASSDLELYRAAILACARARDSESARAVFGAFDRDCPDLVATGELYEALIEAHLAASDIEGAFLVFEWMNEGRGRLPVGVVPGPRVFNLLLRACHQRVLLEKALEVLAWMDSYGMEVDPTLYDEVLQAIDMAELWDVRVLQPNARAHAANVRRLGPPTAVEDIRPAPWDGLRLTYLEDWQERSIEATLAKDKLGNEGWAPATMGLKDVPQHTAPLGSPGVPAYLMSARPLHGLEDRTAFGSRLHSPVGAADRGSRFQKTANGTGLGASVGSLPSSPVGPTGKLTLPKISRGRA